MKPPARRARSRHATPHRPQPIPPAPPLLRDPWAGLVALGILPLLLKCIGAPLGVPVAEDFDFLHRALLQGTGTLLDGGGSQAFWRPLAHQIYYLLFGGLMLSHPGWVAGVHALCLAAGAMLLYRVFREVLPGPAAAIVATFPLMAESTRTLIGWPTQFVDVGLFLFSALALHEASRRRPVTAIVALLAALLCKELAVVTAALLPFVPGPLERRDRVRLGLAAAVVSAAWGAAYLAVRHAAHLELPHFLERSPATLAVPFAAQLAWAFSGSLRAIFSSPLIPGPLDWVVVLALIALLLAAAVILATSAPSRARLAGLRAPIAWGLAWYVLSTATLSAIFPLWQPNRSQIGSVGLGVAATCALGAAHPLLPVGLLGLRIGLLAFAPAPAKRVTVDPAATGAFMDFERLTRLQRFMRDLRKLLQEGYPTLPRGSAVAWSAMPHGLTYSLGGDKALQVWYRDSTLRLISFEDFLTHPEIPTVAMAQFQPDHPHEIALFPATASRAQADAYLASRASRYEEAMRLYELADSLVTDSLAYVFHAASLGGRAFVNLKLGRPEAAIALAEQAQALYPRDVNSQLVLAGEAATRGRYDEAEAWLARLLADDPGLRPALELKQLVDRVRSGAGPAGASVPP